MTDTVAPASTATPPPAAGPPRVTVVGAGALGSHLALLLRNEAQLRVVDFDRVESKNVLAQMHAKQSVGKNKAEALKASLAFLFGARVESVNARLALGNARQLLGGADLLVDCLDNAETRLVMQAYVAHRASEGAPVALLHGALAADGQFGRVVWDHLFKVDAEDVAGQPTCEGGQHLPFIALTASYLALAAQQYLRHGRQLSFNLTPAGGAVRL